jgi:nucleoside-diphosphate-sugar epimerase
MKNILITGGAGFIGSHLTTWLFELGHRIIILDKKYLIDNNLQYGSSGYLTYYYNKLDTEQKSLFSRNVIKLEFDLNSDNIEQLFPLTDIDLCIHLASVVGVNNVLNNTSPTYDSISINLKIYELVQQLKCNLIFASSSEIFGEHTEIHEKSFSVIPTLNSGRRGGYAAQKLVTEFLFAELPQSIQYTSIRFFNITGPGQEITSGMVIPLLIDKISKQEPIVLNKKMERIFTWINHDYIKLSILTIIDSFLVEPIDDMNDTDNTKNTKINVFDRQPINIGLTLDTHFKNLQSRSMFNLDFMLSIINSTINEIENKPPKPYDQSLITKQNKFYESEIHKRILKSSYNFNISDVEFNYKNYIKKLIQDIYLYNKSSI